MKKRLIKIVSVFVALLLVCSLFAVSAGAVTTTCDTYSGSNKEDQNYQTWASPVYSYLSYTSDGRLMTVQHINSTNYAVVTYYDSDYNYLSSKSIPAELPLFGAFYETATNYYIISGQKNPSELSDVECFRITKYDKSWNRISSVGLYDCNTTVPFDAGSVRVAECENYLVIRTSHEMYTTSDGFNHQANVTIQVDTDSMKITDSYTSIMNISMGYVSHSFNQFIKVEDNKIVAVDHGDAVPRSIVLCKYNTNLLEGSFASCYGCCSGTDFVKFPGTIGNNYTGASVGGFEISSTDYIIAGSAVNYDTYVDYSWANQETEIRNIFVSAINKSTNKVTTKYITSYQDGTEDASTPHLVQTGNDTFMLIWSRDNTVYYTQLDGSGNCVGSIHSMEGNLSDCVPAVVGNELKWYVWNNKVIEFYSINLSTLNGGSTAIENGHKYVTISVEDGKATLECSVCGDIKTISLATGIKVWTGTKTYNSYGGYTVSYSSVFKYEHNVGDKLYIKLDTVPSNVEDEFEYISSNSAVAEIKTDAEGDTYIDMLKGGTASITIQSKYNPAVSKTYSIKVISDGLELGDVNGDGGVTVDDATLVQKFIADITEFDAEQTEAADANADGEVTIDDATLIQKYIADIVGKLGA